MTTGIGKRVAALEDMAHALLPPAAPEPFDRCGWMAWLTDGELTRLELLLENQIAAADAAAAIPDDLYRRALARAIMGLDLGQLDELERASRRLLRFDHPDRPGDTMYITATPDPVDNIWRVDPVYLRQTPALPPTLTAAEVERMTVRDPPGPMI